MDRNAFKQIALSTDEKANIIGAWMRFVRESPHPVPRGKETDLQFIQHTTNQTVCRLRDSDPWLTEHVARLFWTCVDIGLLEYQYPYPQRGQSYSPTRLGRIVGRSPQWLFNVFLRAVLTFEAIAGPIKHFTKIRNTVAMVTALIGWYSNPNIQATALALISMAVAIVSTWLAHLLSSGE